MAFIAAKSRPYSTVASGYHRQLAKTIVLGTSASVASGALAYFVYDQFQVPQTIKIIRETIRNNLEVQELLGPNFKFTKRWTESGNQDLKFVKVNARGNGQNVTFSGTLQKQDDGYKILSLAVMYKSKQKPLFKTPDITCTEIGKSTSV